MVAAMTPLGLGSALRWFFYSIKKDVQNGKDPKLVGAFNGSRVIFRNLGFADIQNFDF